MYRVPQRPVASLGHGGGRKGEGLPGGSLSIHGGAGCQEVGDVSDVHAQLQGAAGQGADVQGVVDVLAARGVHAADGQVAQVLPAQDTCLREQMGQARARLQLTQGVVRDPSALEGLALQTGAFGRSKLRGRAAGSRGAESAVPERSSVLACAHGIYAPTGKAPRSTASDHVAGHLLTAWCTARGWLELRSASSSSASDSAHTRAACAQG